MKEDIIIETLALRVEEQKKEIERLKKGPQNVIDAVHTLSQKTHEKMMLALKKNGISYEFKEGTIFVDGFHIFLVKRVSSDGEYGYASAQLFRFFEDGIPEFKFDIDLHGSSIEVEPDNAHPASEYEIMLFDYLLEERGYKRNIDGTLAKI